MLKDKVLNYKLLKIFLLFLLILLPWSFSNNQDAINAKYIDSSTVGYYQINTCDISFIEVLIKNINNNNVNYVFDNYSNIKCFGKVNGVDQSGESFKVGIGTNILINLLIQSFFWLLLFSFIKKGEEKEFKSINVATLFLIGLFLLHLIGERKFYGTSSKNFNLDFSLSNYFILCFILSLLIIFHLIKILFEKRLNNLILFLPFIFLVNSTFNYMNINFLLMIILFLGIQNIISSNYSKRYLGLYVLLCCFWLSQQETNEYLFDIDKLRGFSNTSLNLPSVVFWLISIFLLIHGIIYVIKNSMENFDNNQLAKNFIITGSLITVFGVLSSLSSVFNFFSYYYLGLSKRGMTQISSIAGNTWRGIAPSAESIGEYFAFSIFLFLFFVYKKEIKLNGFYLIILSINIFGILRANNIAAILSITFLFLFFIVTQKIQINFKLLFICLLIIVPLIFGFFFYGRETSYDAASKSIILEGLRYSNLFENEKDRNLNVDRFFLEEDDLGTIFLYEENKEKISTSLRYMMNTYNQKNNISFIPNGVAFLSVFALAINRSEKWGIFFSKYNPDISELLFGSGPLQLNSYFFGHNRNNIDGLVLPHSSFLDIILFTGLIGFFLFVYFVLKTSFKNINNNNPYWYLLLFLLLNWLKSDSILYMSSLILFVFTFIKNLDTSTKD